MSCLQKEVTICNRLGLHTRAATKLAVLAAKFDAKIEVIQGDKQAPAASVLGLLMLEGSMGKKITIKCQGEAASTALDAICTLIESKFDESN